MMRHLLLAAPVAALLAPTTSGMPECGPGHRGFAPVPDREGPVYFVTFEKYSELANRAETPRGYERIFYDADSIVAARKQIEILNEYPMSAYSSTNCAFLCNKHERCNGFGTYIRREPIFAPSPSFRNPKSTADFFCTLWNSTSPYVVPTNTGEKWLDFDIVYAGSNGYTKQAITPDTALTETANVAGTLDTIDLKTIDGPESTQTLTIVIDVTKTIDTEATIEPKAIVTDTPTETMFTQTETEITFTFDTVPNEAATAEVEALPPITMTIPDMITMTIPDIWDIAPETTETRRPEPVTTEPSRPVPVTTETVTAEPTTVYNTMDTVFVLPNATTTVCPTETVIAEPGTTTVVIPTTNSDGLLISTTLTVTFPTTISATASDGAGVPRTAPMGVFLTALLVALGIM